MFCFDYLNMVEGIKKPHARVLHGAGSLVMITRYG